MIGKATLYTRYTNKSQLFAAVLRRRILLVYAPMEAGFRKGLTGKTLEKTLLILLQRIVKNALSLSGIALSRIVNILRQSRRLY